LHAKPRWIARETTLDCTRNHVGLHAKPRWIARETTLDSLVIPIIL